MTTLSSILFGEIPWTEEPSGLESMGLQRAGHDLTTKQHHIQKGKVFLPLQGFLNLYFAHKQKKNTITRCLFPYIFELSHV